MRYILNDFSNSNYARLRSMLNKYITIQKENKVSKTTLNADIKIVDKIMHFMKPIKDNEVIVKKESETED